MTMNNMVRERRVFMLREYGRSYSLRNAVKLTATEYECNEASLYVDWSRRKVWLKEICDFKNAGVRIRELILDQYRLMAEIDELKENADNSNCKLGALKLAVHTRFKMIDILRELGNQELERVRLEEIDKMFPDPLNRTAPSIGL
jgi:hypothetical protein